MLTSTVGITNYKYNIIEKNIVRCHNIPRLGTEGCGLNVQGLYYLTLYTSNKYTNFYSIFPHLTLNKLEITQ